MKVDWVREYAKIGNVTVVHVDLSANISNESEAHGLLDRDEQIRATRFDTRAARRRFTLCRAGLRIYLSETTGISNSALSFTSERNEKPKALVRGREIRCNFNVSHTEDHGLLGFSKTGRIGVDIERRNERYENIGELLRVFSEHERRVLILAKHGERAELFMKLWTFKEAFIKAIGEGFRADTTAFSIPDALLRGDKDQAEVRFEHLSDASWRLHSLNDTRFIGAVAHEIP